MPTHQAGLTRRFVYKTYLLHKRAAALEESLIWDSAEAMLELSRSWVRASLAILVTACMLAAFACRVVPGPRPIFRQDLRPFGFPTASLGRIVGSFTDISFLTNDLVLVTVNTRTYGEDDQEPSDLPESKLLLFDIRRRALRNSVSMPAQKAKGSVQSAGNGQFLLLNSAGLQICSAGLECDKPVDARARFYLSPRGTRIAVGGRLEEKILDGKTLAELQSFGANEPRVIPGDSGDLYEQKGKLYVKLADKSEPQFVLDGVSTGVWPDARFLDANTVAALQSEKQLAIARLDGQVLFRLPVDAGSYVAEVSTAAFGSRFCFHDAGYTGFSSLLNFFNVDEPFNRERVNVREIATGKSHFRLVWDPRPYLGSLSRPALSPDGHRVAIIRLGFLEVYEVR
jgi:hypothetical protein